MAHTLLQASLSKRTKEKFHKSEWVKDIHIIKSIKRAEKIKWGLKTLVLTINITVQP